MPASFEFLGRRIECRAENLSRSGALLVGKFAPPDAASLPVTLGSPGGDLELATDGRVVRCRVDTARGETTIGIEFGELGAEQRARLESLLARVVEGVTPSAIEDLPDNATPQEIRAALDSVPLPHRIQLAARGMPRERELLIHDPHLQVVDALARNPNLLLHEVLAIVRNANVLPHTLELIGRDSRWSSNRPLLVLLAGHRNTPFATACRIIERMPQDSLRKLLQSADLKPALREKVLRRLPGGRRP